MSSILCIIRHGQSVWNEKNLFTGWTDVPLTNQGKIDSKKAAIAIKDLSFEIAFTSVLKRAIESLEIILNELAINIPVIKSEKFHNHRHERCFNTAGLQDQKEKPRQFTQSGLIFLLVLPPIGLSFRM